MAKTLDYVRSKQVVDSGTVRKIQRATPAYASLVLQRLRKKGLLRQITRNKYTMSDNIYAVATNLYTPSYLSFWSASAYYGYSTQILNTIQVATTTRRKPILFDNYKLRFLPLNKRSFFGFTKIQMDKTVVFLAEPEKLLIDAFLRPREMGNFDEIIALVQKADINKEKIVDYLKRIDQTSLIKRIGCLLEMYKEMDISLYFSIKDKNYIQLNPFAAKAKTINSKWKVKL